MRRAGGVLAASGALAVLALISCGPRPAALFEEATADFRQGRLAEALAKATRGRDRAGGPAGRWKFELLRAEILLRQRPPQELLPLLEAPLPETPAFAPLRARQSMLAGQAWLSARRWEEAAAALERARRLAAACGARDVLLTTEILEGSRLSQLGRQEDAEALLKDTVARAALWNDPRAEAGATLIRGMNRLTRLRYDEATPFFERAVALARAQPGDLYSAALINLAICRARLGDFDASLRGLRESIAILEQADAKIYLASALGELGNLEILRGAPREAIRYLQRALDLARQFGRGEDAARWASNLALAYSELREWDAAERYNGESAALKQRHGSRTLVYNRMNRGRIALGRGRLDEAETHFREALRAAPDNPGVQWDSHAGLAEAARARGDAAAADRHFRRAVAVVEKTRSSLMRTEYRLSFLTGLISFYRRYVDFLLEEGREAEALAVADSSRARVLAEQFGAAASPRRPPGEFVRLARTARAVLLVYWLAPRQSRLWVVSPQGIRSHALRGEAEIASRVEAYAAAIRNLADPVRPALPVGRELYDLLIRPAEPLPAGIRRVVVVADGALHGLNLETLPAPGPGPRYWLEEVEITVAPALSILAERRASAAPPRLLLIGDPVAADPQFPPLAYAAAEIASIAESFRKADLSVHRGGAAAPEAYAGAGAATHIHFSAHAVANPEHPLDSAVILSPGKSGYKLYARDLLATPLRAELVTLSACRGAGSRAYSGEGLVGFTWSFLRAGAARVIAGLWNVDDQSTARLMADFYQRLGRGAHPEAALREAKLALLRAPGNFRKPYYWGAFQVYRATAAR